ncbi:hypothetical protein NZK35_21205 [Stieleria sp. ICT_E10.1]|uniref:hypothetical protein n=1 Tax=Stieleria sedimenti TaxID=2976331 RepID=UPI00217FB8BF|nr:hypothetical protein [Stieleria sedimenti]MCS7469179.1 hypothetical protein [Stieleria sedimenti]
MRFSLIVLLLVSIHPTLAADVQESAFFSQSAESQQPRDATFCGFTLGGSMDQAVKEVPKSMRFLGHKKDGRNETVVFKGGPLKGTPSTALIFVNEKLAMVQLQFPNQKYALIKLAEQKYEKQLDDGTQWIGTKDGIMVTVNDKAIVASHLRLLEKMTENNAANLGSL